MKIGKSLALSALIIAGLLIGSRAQSQPGPGHPGHFGGPRMFETLQLTDGQKTTIDGLFAANRENARALLQRLQE